jgi:hypothetical protein
MCTPYIVMYVTDGHVDWPVDVVAGSDRDSRLVAAKNDGDEHRPDCVGVFSDRIL